VSSCIQTRNIIVAFVRITDILLRSATHASRSTLPGAGCDALQDEVLNDARTESPFRPGGIFVLEAPKEKPC
jgi:hypothetical protein